MLDIIKEEAFFANYIININPFMFKFFALITKSIDNNFIKIPVAMHHSSIYIHDEENN